MGTDNRIEATAKKIKGKIQEIYGKITDDPKHEVKGQANQAEARIRHSVENAKDETRKTLD